MLVVAWEAMDTAIPRLQAQENLLAFTVATAASPYIEQNSRESILGLWRSLIAKGLKSIISTHDDNSPSVEQLPDGNTLRRNRKDMPLSRVKQVLKDAFGREMWD